MAGQLKHRAARKDQHASYTEAQSDQHVSQTEATPEQHSHVQTERDTQIGRSTAMMSGLVIVSRLTGYARTWAQAIALGVTIIASCYSVANNLPNQLYEIVVGGMLVTAFLPVYLSEKQRAGQEGASRYASNLFSTVVVLMGIATVLCIVFAAQVIWTQSFSAVDDFDANLAVYFFRFFAIEILLYSLSSILSGILNAERDYFWSNAAPIFNNFVTTASFLAYAFLCDKQPALALIILALGNPLGVLAQVVVQIPVLARYGIRFRWGIDLHDPALRDTVRIGIPSLVVMLCSFETSSVMTSSALSVTAVGASVSSYARLWFTLPYSIFAVPITTAMFTELSDDVAQGNMDSYRKGVTSGISRITFWMIPFALFLIVFATPLVRILAGGTFSDAEIAMTANYLCGLAVSLPAYGVCNYLQKVCSAIRRMKFFTWASIIAAIIQTILCVSAAYFFGLTAVALTSTVYMLTVDIVTLMFLRKELGSFGLRAIVGAALRSFCLGLLGSAVGMLVAYVLPSLAGLDLSQSIILLFAQVIAGGVPALIVSFGGALLLGMPEANAIGGFLKAFRSSSK